MNLKSVLFLTAIAMVSTIQAQDLKILVNQKGKVGFSDKEGNEVIKCQYESVSPFTDGISIVTKSGKSGMIDVAGNVILPLKYSQITKWNEKFYLIKNGKTQGLANREGKIVVEPNYSFISKPNCYGKALIALGGKQATNDKKAYMQNAKYGIIDSDGNIKVTPKYKGLFEFSSDVTNLYPYYEGKALAYSYHYLTDTLITDCSYLGFSAGLFGAAYSGVMDGNGNELIKPNIYYFVMEPKSGMVRYYISKKKKTLCGYYDLEAKNAFQVAEFDKALKEMNFWSHGDFAGNIAPVNGSVWSFIDKSGKSLRTGYTNLMHSPVTGLWAAKNSSDTWDVFDGNSTDVAALSGFSRIVFPKTENIKEVFSVMKDGKMGGITRTGDIVVPFEYDFITGNTYDVMVVIKDGKCGAVSSDNKTIVPIEYIDMLIPQERGTENYWVKKADSLYYHLNTASGKISDTGYKAVTNFINGIAHVAPVGMTIENNIVNRAQLLEPNSPNDSIVAVSVEKNIGTYGYLIDTDNNVVIDRPVSVKYKEKVLAEIKKYGRRKLTQTEKKNIMLNVTRDNRSYDLKSVLGEDEWNY